MKWIIWWCALMVILPFLYLFWWKKRWRVLWGVIILAVLVVGYILPGEYARSILATKIGKEKPAQQLEEVFQTIPNAEPNPNDPEKLKLEKSILKLQREIQKDLEKFPREAEQEKQKEEWLKILEKKSHERRLINNWVEKWGQKENSRALLFCGEEFNEQLATNRDKLWTAKEYNIIDFGSTESSSPEFLQKKVAEICKQEKNYEEKLEGHSPTIWLKNIDKITNPELENELVKIIDPKQNTNLGKQQVERSFYFLGKKIRINKVEEIIDLSQFTLVATTSVSNPKLSNKIKAELKPIEPFFDKYRWIIFGVSTTMEIIVLLWLTRSRKKEKKVISKN
ncbi:membrane protein of unknown function [endosymbiont DhMRE of Dentiscutata heterogama]|uniref:hypothetical protein n=1 Tax=endosymbiont DhMRE of Dentiscutata heterogama TaxID=1609546 RepID=UPI000629D44B|nr:hypothetical protein [endosymbiont DhMRE of Dentiscutata heterogama]CFW92892.1 membrane protein of unknown function [endosymbiont DhMRE of Dentiscutata heterogama]